MNSRRKLVLMYLMTSIVMLVFARICNTAVTTLSEQSNTARGKCVVIDPGHGGEDGGAVSCSGRPESIYNLEISRCLNDLIMLLGYKTKMIRNDDRSVYTKGETLAQKKVSDLKERVKITNETDGAVLISIHQNYFGDNRYKGAQVFYAKTDGSEEFAKKLQTNFISKLNCGSRRQAKKSSGIYLMEQISCPGILVECGFLSNAEEEALLRTAEYQKKVSAVIAVTTSQYLSNT